MTASDWLGLAGSLLILVQPARDQALRVRVWRRRRSARLPANAERAPDDIRRFDDWLAHGFERARNSWRALDSASMAAGALLLAGSYLTT